MGPSARAVLQLSDAGRSGSTVAPPLQRSSRAYFRPADPVLEEDCLASHVRELQARETKRKVELQTTRKEHHRDIRELRGQFATAFEEVAARRAWSRQVAAEQQAQTAGRTQREIDEYRRERDVKEFWPFETSRRGAPVLDMQTYGAQLLVQAEERRAAQRHQTTPPGPKLLSSSAPTSEYIPPLGIDVALVPAIITKRKVVREQAQKRVQQQQSSQPHQDYFTVSMVYSDASTPTFGTNPLIL